MRGPSRAAADSRTKPAGTTHMGGCESGFTVPDPTDPNIVWATCYGNKVTRWDARITRTRAPSARGCTRSTRRPTSSSIAATGRRRWPSIPSTTTRVYYGCQVIFKTTNAGQSWSVISPDLSTQDPAHIVPSGGIVGDNLGQFYGEVVFAIAPSKIQKGLIWAGTNDGQVWYTKDAAANWNNVTQQHHRPAAAGHDHQHRAVELRCRHRLHQRRFAPGGQPRSVHLQDHGFRQDLEADQRQSAQARAVLRAHRHRRSQLRRAAVRRHGQRPVLLARRRRALDGAADRIAARARDLGRGAEAVSRSGGLDLRPRPLHPRRHHAAGADGEASRRCRRSCLFEPRPAYRFVRGAQAMLNFSLTERSPRIRSSSRSSTRRAR